MRGVWCLGWLAAVACDGGDDGDDGGNEGDALAIAGTYVDDSGTEHVITEEEWVLTYPSSDPLVFHVLSFDNTQERIVAHNAPENTYNGNQFSAFDWASVGSDEVWYCQTVFDAASEEDAALAPRADDADLVAGCGGFPWTNLTP